MKSEEREIEQIPATELNKYISEFIMSVRTKDGKEYEPTSFRSLVVSFERHLKSKSSPSSIINGLVKSKEKILKKQGKGNKPNASVALTNEEIQIIYEKKYYSVLKSLKHC